MTSNQPSDHHLEAAAAYVKQILAEKQQQQVQVAQHQQPTAQAQFLNQYLSGGTVNAPPLCQVGSAASHQSSLSRLVADYLKASQGQAAPTLPPNLLAGLQAAAIPVVQQRPPQQLSLASNHAAAQQQLLASAQLLSAVNPGLAAAAMAQALTMVNTSTASASQQQLGAQHHNLNMAKSHLNAAPAPPQTATMSLVQQRPASHPQQLVQPSNGVLASHSLPVGLRRPTSQPPIQHQVSAGAVAQYRQHPQVLQVGKSSIHSNISSPGNSAIIQHQQKRPIEIAAAPITKQPTPISLLHAVSSGGSISHNSKTNKPVQALSAVSAVAATTSSKNSSPSLPARTQSSITSTSLPTSSSSGSANGSGGMNVQAVAAGLHHHRGHHGAAVASSGRSAVHASITTMQRWSLAQLDAHVKQLKAADQKVPQAVALLAADMRRKEEKRLAKRLANRKSACTSRARKKALIEEMTKDNARLRRQALILSYLPDPVVAISTEGTITFCSMQVERVLKHQVDDLIGANIEDVIVPSSRESIRTLIRDLVIAEQRALASSVEEESGENNSAANGSDRENNSAAVLPHEVSEHSSEQSVPPLLEVKVKAGHTSTEVAAGEDVSDSSGDPPSKNGQAKSGGTTQTEMSSLTHKNSESEDQQPPPAKKVKIALDEKKSSTESDESISSQNKASANLTKNVGMCKLNKDKEGAEQVRFSHKDDVMGASVTANNADAKLSSLMHHPKMEGGSPESSAKKPEVQVAPIRRKHGLGPKMANGKQEEQSSSSAESSLRKKKRSGNSSEDSGYRESNESLEEESNEYAEDSSSYSSSDRSSSKKKRRRTRPLAPACNVRLIRNDLSTIWCELTSSIRTRPSNDFEYELNAPLKAGKNENDDSVSSEPEQEEKELLLCFRPIREGGVVGEELRFCSKVSESEKMSGSDDPASSEDQKPSSNNSASSKDGGVKKEAKKPVASTSADAPSSAETEAAAAAASAAAAPSLSKPVRKNRPPKKRKFESEDDYQPIKQSSGKKSHGDHTHADEPDEKSAVESMMELAKNPL